jgi:type I restriction-modification system DNA methylase subunit
MTREEAKQVIEKLAERFAEHRKDYHAADYNEAKTRQDFINPFFKALGWDVDNENGMSEAYREVIYEDKVVVRGKAKAPDYGFRLMGQGKKRLFYVEAKKPSVSLKANKDAAYQLRRYGSSAQAPISILTNFEDFIVYDCAKVPNQNDSASVSRIKHIPFEKYAEEFDFIYDTFSHEAVTKGRFDKFVQSDANKKGSQTLDKEFVQSLDTWRKYLATSIAVNNKKINDEELNFCVQLIIDRLIFLRFCEDRSVEPYGQLQSAAAKGNAYSNLFELFEQADDKYNSGLFDFEKDQLTAGLKIDNKVIKTIVDDLYFPQCRYEFSVMPVEVLGNAYEQFLGKVIRLLPSRGVKIEEKPEVRKAGGVFYTPQYIVEYIVKNTVGKLIEDKAPKEISTLKIVDPACGSGSFLVGAFEYLLNYHIDWYHRNLSEKDKKKGDIVTPDGKLTTHEKKRILINNIYGVDLDANAVEVSKLSLLLKCMEGETEASIKQQVSMFHERVLPDLDHNIKDGNSLIDVDFYDEQIDLGYEKKIKPFSWKKGFPEVFKHGGFDVVVGNPPWGAEFGPYDSVYIVKKYPAIPSKTKDSYLAFIVKAISLLKESGNLGFIIPNTWMLINTAEKFRNFILDFEVNEISDYGDGVFPDATVESSILILKNSLIASGSCLSRRIVKGKEVINHYVNKEIWRNDELKRILLEKDQETLDLQKKIRRESERFDANCEIIWGIKPYQVGHGNPTQTRQMVDKRVYHSDTKIDSTWKPILVGSHVNRYQIKYSDFQYIKYGKNLMYGSNEKKILSDKILLRQTSDKIRACIDKKKFYCQNSVFIISSNTLNLNFLLGLLNSTLFNFLYQLENPQKGKVFAEIKPSVIKSLPIKSIKQSEQKKFTIKSLIEKNVQLILELQEQIEKEKVISKTQQIKSRIEQLDEKIDSLVYELYALTDQEIKIIEGGAHE